jgi:hypothetical protein
MLVVGAYLAFTMSNQKMGKTEKGMQNTLNQNKDIA